MTISDAVVRRILELCDERSLTINGISNVAGVTQSTVSDIVNQKTNNAGVSTLKKLCDGFGITIREFFDNPVFDDVEQEVK
ncbi:MAG: helix-turn-helix transcriptional regulator [Clostridia bacterium]